MNYKISIIIPIYNAQDTLKIAINSVINQTIGFENIELILVDDKSTDKSKDIINNYSNKYDNVKPIFLKKNSGSPSKPRNIGIDNVTSPYLTFLDNDDELMTDYCETLYNKIEKENIDIVYCQNAFKFLDGVFSKPKHSKESCEVENPLFLRWTMWGAIFRTSFIKKYDIKCPPTLCEDGVFAIKAFSQANKIIKFQNYYGYIHTVENKNHTSITHNRSKYTYIEYLKGFCIIRDYLNENNLNNEKLWINNLPFILFMFLKVKGNKEEKINMLKIYRKFVLSLNYPNIKLKLKPLDILNKAIINEQYTKGIILSSIYQCYQANFFCLFFLIF